MTSWQVSVWLLFTFCQEELRNMDDKQNSSENVVGGSKHNVSLIQN